MLESQPADCDATQRLVDITEIAPGLPERASHGDEFGHNRLTLGDLPIDRVYDPVYQALLATSLLRPR